MCAKISPIDNDSTEWWPQVEVPISSFTLVSYPSTTSQVPYTRDAPHSWSAISAVFPAEFFPQINILLR